MPDKRQKELDRHPSGSVSAKTPEIASLLPDALSGVETDDFRQGFTRSGVAGFRRGPQLLQEAPLGASCNL